MDRGRGVCFPAFVAPAAVELLSRRVATAEAANGPILAELAAPAVPRFFP